MNCPNCGSFNPETSHYCNNCGVELNVDNKTIVQNNQYQPANRININSSFKNKKAKSPMVALVLSLLIVGLGQFYNGNAKKGILMLGGALLGGIISMSILWWFMALWSAYDAYNTAKTAPEYR